MLWRQAAGGGPPVALAFCIAPVALRFVGCGSSFDSSARQEARESGSFAAGLASGRMESIGRFSSTGATPRTPHSPDAGPVGSSAAGGMAAPPRSAGPAAAASVRPVTARTWQAMAGAPTAEEGRRMSFYTNDLFNNAGSGGAALPDARPVSPLYQPASARPGTPSTAPTPRSAERLQHQRIATPSRLQAEGSSPRAGQRVQQVPGFGLSTANVPAVQEAAAPVSAPLPDAAQAAQQKTVVSQRLELPDAGARPSTAPTSPLRTTTFSLAALKPPAQQQQAQQQQQVQQQQPMQEAQQQEQKVQPAAQQPQPTVRRLSYAGANSSIALDSPRVRQQVLRNFAGAQPAAPRPASRGGTSSPLGSTPRPMLHGERAAGSPNGRPSTPSFQPVTMPARPATAMAGPVASGAAAEGDARFTLKAVPAQGQQAGGDAAAAAKPAFALQGPRGGYPEPPRTAPSKCAAGPQPAAPPQAPEPTSLAAFGISSAAFVAPPAKGPRGQAKAGGEQGAEEGKAALAAPTQAGMLLASASFASQADLRRFLLSPGPADKPLCCKIVRSGGGLLKGGPLYTLLVEAEGGKAGAFLLAARKRKGGPGGATYVLSVDQADVSRHSPSYVGKLRSNFIGTEFVAFDAGSSRKGEGAPRCELGSVLYQTNVLGSKGPRKMTVLLPKLESGGGRPLAHAPRSEADSLLGQYKSYALSSCVVLRNKPPRWNAAMGAYCLNFGGRVTQASVKNFQLVSVDNMDRTILQFGKVAGDAFTMDYSYPMTALQAFAICLSSFDSKLACE